MLQLTLALIVCNLLVVVTYMYRVILSSPNGSLPSESDSSSEDDDFTTPVCVTRTSRLTTVDLGSNSEAMGSNWTRATSSSLHRSFAT